MPRQSKGDRTPIMLRVDPALAAKVDAAAKTAWLDRTAWIIRAIERDLDGGGRHPPSVEPMSAPKPRGKKTTPPSPNRASAEPAPRVSVGSLLSLPPGAKLR